MSTKNFDTNTVKTLEKLQRMHFFGMHSAFQATIEGKGSDYDRLTPFEFFAQMVDVEFDDRKHRQVTRSIKNAKFKQKASLAEIDFFPRENWTKIYWYNSPPGALSKMLNTCFYLGALAQARVF